jgi:hypothetical protein
VLGELIEKLFAAVAIAATTKAPRRTHHELQQSTLAEISESPISVFVASEMIQSISRDCTY